MSTKLPVINPNELPPENGDPDVADKYKNNASLLAPSEQVLPTLERDGKRRWITPSLSLGNHWHQRRIVAYGLIAFFVTLPHLRFNGKPPILLDLAHREFTILGHTFYPTDAALLACLVLMAFFTVMLVTALAGRAWCGWGCPHTVYMEYVFRPVDRFFDGTLGRGGSPRQKRSLMASVARLVVYMILCMAIAHTFLSYFVGTDALAHWMLSSPSKHPGAFLLMAGSSLAMLYHGLVFREQLCLIACPYGRFQSVMLDRQSLIVAYDSKRGEPRGKLRSVDSEDKTPRGDCVDCRRCIAVCPTGIDIRHGLQLECVHCTQCIDACDEVMVKIEKPKGLIRYSTQDGLEGKRTSLIRPRTVLYSVLLSIVTVLFFVILATKFAFDARLLPTSGAPFAFNQQGMVQNNFRVRLVNRSQQLQKYTLSIPNDDAVAHWSSENQVELAPGKSQLIPMRIEFPASKTNGTGKSSAKLSIKDETGGERQFNVQLIGPR